MSPSTHIHYGSNNSTETTTHATSNSYYVIQSNFATTIKDLLTKSDYKFKESLKETIAYQDAKSDKKLEKDTDLVIPYLRGFHQFSLKLDDQDKKTSSFTSPYIERPKKMRANDKLSTKFEIAKKELEETMNTRLDEFKS